MKKILLGLVVFVLVLSVSAETEYLGQAAFTNSDGTINLAVDASVVFRSWTVPISCSCCLWVRIRIRQLPSPGQYHHGLQRPGVQDAGDQRFP